MADEPRLRSVSEPALRGDLADEIYELVDRCGAVQQKLARMNGGKGITGRKREALDALAYAVAGTAVLLDDLRRRGG